MERREFETTVESGERGRVFIRMPFDPREVWGRKSRYYVKGTIGGAPFRGSLGSRDGSYFVPLNQELRHSAGVGPGDRVSVSVEPDEAEQLALPEELAEALEANPAARDFFASLSAFYRNEYIEWVAEAKKAQTRGQRVAEAVQLLAAGKKQR